MTYIGCEEGGKGEEGLEREREEGRSQWGGGRDSFRISKCLLGSACAFSLGGEGGVGKGGQTARGARTTLGWREMKGWKRLASAFNNWLSPFSLAAHTQDNVKIFSKKYLQFLENNKCIKPIAHRKVTAAFPACCPVSGECWGFKRTCKPCRLSQSVPSYKICLNGKRSDNISGLINMCCGEIPLLWSRAADLVS